jgi:hypothetical protein
LPDRETLRQALRVGGPQRGLLGVAHRCTCQIAERPATPETTVAPPAGEPTPSNVARVLATGAEKSVAETRFSDPGQESIERVRLIRMLEHAGEGNAAAGAPE